MCTWSLTLLSGSTVMVQRVGRMRDALSKLCVAAKPSTPAEREAGNGWPVRRRKSEHVAESADGGVAPDRALFISGLQPGKVTHQLLVQVGLIQLGSQQQHRLRVRGRGEKVVNRSKYLNSLFSDGGVGVCEAVDN
ncbi:hypothetical protein F7725_010293, partial [Dissostichus mawsoni]